MVLYQKILEAPVTDEQAEVRQESSIIGLHLV